MRAKSQADHLRKVDIFQEIMRIGGCAQPESGCLVLEFP